MSTVADFTTPVDRHKFSLQYVTTPTADTPGTTLVLRFDKKRYLFGRISEGTQRACTERGVALKKARNFFLTGETKWETNGGLLGMVLTIADVASDTAEEERQAAGRIQIHGGPKIWHAIACARRFVFRTGMPLDVLEASPARWKASTQPDFHDDRILLWALPVQRSSILNHGASTNVGLTRDPTQVEEDQILRQKTVYNMFNSDWQKDRLHEATFSEIALPAMVWVRDPKSKSLQATFCSTLSDAPHIAPDETVLVRMPWPAALVSQLPSAGNLPSNVAMSYFVKGRPQRGAFIAAKAKAAGVTPGPDYGLLASGQSVTTASGRVVKSEEVMDAILPGYGAAILDVPAEEYLGDLAQKLVDLRNVGVLVNVHAFCWILGPGVAASQAFEQFTLKFPEVRHVVSSSDHVSDTLAMDSSAASTARLHRIRPESFIVPRHDNDYKAAIIEQLGAIPAQRGLVLNMVPEFGVDQTEIPPSLDIPAICASMSDHTISSIPEHPTADAPLVGPYDDVTITTLGTGSAVPSKYRNVSANLVHIPSLGYFMFDAGENTLGQLKRMYSPEDLDEVLCNLHMVWISHLHADHHLGTVSLLAARKAAVQRRADAGRSITHQIYLVSERNMADYLEEYKSVEAHDAIMIRCLKSELVGVDDEPISLTNTTLPIRKLDTVRVSHCHGAQAISVTFSNGFKLSYSGDCRPSSQFAEIGQDSDVLIHEATFDDGMEGDALAKKHSTIGEALGVAHAMKAKNIILTHFSQRYQKLPTLQDVRPIDPTKMDDGNDDSMEPMSVMENADTNGDSNGDNSAFKSRVPEQQLNELGNPSLRTQTSLETAAQEIPICIAFDFMRVTIPQMKDMYRYYPAFESMFDYEESKSDEKRRVLREANEAMANTKNKKAEATREAKLAKQAKVKKVKETGVTPNGKQKKRNKNRADLFQVEQPDGTVSTDNDTTASSMKRTERSKSPLLPADQSSKKPKLDNQST